MWHPLQINCPECKQAVVFRAIAFNVEGGIGVEGICLTPGCKTHLERKVVSFEANFASVIADCAVNNANQHFVEN